MGLVPGPVLGPLPATSPRTGPSTGAGTGPTFCAFGCVVQGPSLIPITASHAGPLCRRLGREAEGRRIIITIIIISRITYEVWTELELVLGSCLLREAGCVAPRCIYRTIRANTPQMSETSKIVKGLPFAKTEKRLLRIRLKYDTPPPLILTRVFFMFGTCGHFCNFRMPAQRWPF